MLQISFFRLICWKYSSIGGLAPQTPQQGNKCFPTPLPNRFALPCLYLADLFKGCPIVGNKLGGRAHLDMGSFKQRLFPHG